uniref:Uncharacterized protein n=1 Tax=Vitis vinifera TaxID=29760 RepID=A5C884_VITVI|nr:hypothetical protein VITISV_023165 [Vitis vinifera]
MAHECHFAAQEPPFRSYEPPKHEILHFAGKAPFGRVFGSCEADFGTRVPFRSTFQSLGSQESIASNGARFGFETEKLWSFEDDCANHERKCRTSILLLLDTFLKYFLELKLCIRYLVSNLGKLGVQRFKRCDTPAKSLLSCEMSCEITFELRNGYEMISKLRNDYEMISKLRNGCEITSKLRNGLQIAKLTCEMEEGLQKHFAKPREVAKMPTEPCDHASEEKSPAHPEVPLPPYFLIAFVTLRTMFSLVGGRVEEEHQLDMNQLRHQLGMNQPPGNARKCMCGGDDHLAWKHCISLEVCKRLRTTKGYNRFY